MADALRARVALRAALVLVRVVDAALRVMVAGVVRDCIFNAVVGRVTAVREYVLGVLVARDCTPDATRFVTLAPPRELSGVAVVRIVVARDAVDCCVFCVVVALLPRVPVPDTL